MYTEETICEADIYSDLNTWVHKFSKILEAKSRFWAPEGDMKEFSILRTNISGMACRTHFSGFSLW